MSNAFWLLNISIQFLGYTFFLVPEFTGTYQRGFYCDDESITMEFKENTISIPQLLIASILACIVTVSICRWNYFAKKTNVLDTNLRVVRFTHR